MTKKEWVKRYEQWCKDCLDSEISFTIWMGMLTKLIHDAKDIIEKDLT